MVETGILAFIGVACTVFAIVSAYLIYGHVKDETEQVYRARVRREKDQGAPSDYLNATNAKRKKAPVVVPPQMAKEEEALIPDPDPSLDPIVTDELPPPEPETAAPPEPVQPDADGDLAPLAAAAPPVAIAGAAAAAVAPTLAKPPPPPPPPQEKPPTPKKQQEKSPTKTEKGSKKDGDFDDYRNFSPKALPPPKGAPPPAVYEPPVSPVHVDEQSIPMQSMERVSRSNMDREGLRF